MTLSCTSAMMFPAIMVMMEMIISRLPQFATSSGSIRESTRISATNVADFEAVAM